MSIAMSVSESIMRGVYSITNTLTGRVYIGSSVDVAHRVRMHYRDLAANRHKNIHLQRAWNIYGTGAFAVRLVESVIDGDNAHLWAREQAHIDATPLKYNIVEWSSRPPSRKGIPGPGGKKGSTKSAAWRAKVSAATKGKPRWTPEQRQAIGDRQRGRPRVLSDEARERLRQLMIGNKRWIRKKVPLGV